MMITPVDGVNDKATFLQ